MCCRDTRSRSINLAWFLQTHLKSTGLDKSQLLCAAEVWFGHWGKDFSPRAVTSLQGCAGQEVIPPQCKQRNKPSMLQMIRLVHGSSHRSSREIKRLLFYRVPPDCSYNGKLRGIDWGRLGKKLLSTLLLQSYNGHLQSERFFRGNSPLLFVNSPFLWNTKVTLFLWFAEVYTPITGQWCMFYGVHASDPSCLLTSKWYFNWTFTKTKKYHLQSWPRRAAQ